MDFFVIRFYYYFLRTKTSLLFQQTDIKHQYEMFQTSLDVILTHITDPTLLAEHLQELLKTHVEYGVLNATTTSSKGFEVTNEYNGTVHYNYKIWFSYTYDGYNSITINSVSHSTRAWIPWYGGQTSLTWDVYSYFDYGCYCLRYAGEIHGVASFGYFGINGYLIHMDFTIYPTGQVYVTYDGGDGSWFTP